MSKYDHELKHIQQEYLAILKSFPLESDEDFYYHAVSLVDKCELFWMSRRLEMLEILSDLSACAQCFFLSGAIYLDISGNGHYAFGAIGERSIINDPVLRMKNFFISNINSVSDRLKHYFSSAVSDTITVLEQYSDYFIVISTESLLYADADDNLELGEKVYWDVLSSALNYDIRDLETLRNKFPTIGELEKDLGIAAKRFIFSDLHDAEASLGDRVKRWFAENNRMIPMSISNEIDQFFIASKSQIQQTLDILQKSLCFNLFPYIRFEVTLQYFILIAGAFSDDDSIKLRIEYALISNLFDNYVIPENIDEVDFFKHCQLCKEKRIWEIFRNAVFSDGTSFFSINMSDAVRIMTEVYKAEIQDVLSLLEKESGR